MSERGRGEEEKKRPLFWAFLISLSRTGELAERTRLLHGRLLQKQMLTPKKYWFFMLFLLAENCAEASTNDHLFDWDTCKKKTNISCVRRLFFLFFFFFFSCRSDALWLPKNNRIKTFWPIYQLITHLQGGRASSTWRTPLRCSCKWTLWS